MPESVLNLSPFQLKSPSYHVTRHIRMIGDTPSLGKFSSAKTSRSHPCQLLGIPLPGDYGLHTLGHMDGDKDELGARADTRVRPCNPKG